MILTLATLAAVSVLCSQAAVANENTVFAAAIGYLALSVVMAGCAWAFCTRALSARGALDIRWLLIAAGALSASIGYLPSFIQGFLDTAPARGFQTACFNASEALYILAAVLFFADVARSIVVVDILQVLLFVALRFNLIYSNASRDHFTVNHLTVGTFVALFLFLMAMVACLGAASRAELRFLQTLSWFFGLRLIGFFLSNQVSYTWLHYTNCSMWDVGGTSLLAGFALHLLYTGYRQEDSAWQTASGLRANAAPLNPPSVMVRSLMPSFLALVNVMLGLFLLQISVLLAVIAISASVLSYVVRTMMLQAQAMKEKALLESRNEQLEGLAIRDPLTGIGNRRSLAEGHDRMQAAAGGKCLSLVLMDIDHFKQANDRHGHLHGDKVLIALSRQLESLAATVAGSHCARLGGDEFALLLPDVTPQAALVLAEELCLKFSEYGCDLESSSVSLSIGIASQGGSRNLPLETLVSCADKALYRAKLLGRNRVEVEPVWEPGSAVCASATPALRGALHHSAS
jgi:diguanylate cyclase (GGDEF)-like protein